MAPRRRKHRPEDDFTLAPEIDWDSWQPGSQSGATMARNLALLIAQGVGLEADWHRRATARGSLLASIEDRKLDQLAETVADAVARGDSVQTLEQTLRGVLDRTTWADLVAVTETARAMTAAALDTYQQQGVPAREFVISPVDTIIGAGGSATRKDRVCARCHANADAGPIPLGDEFPHGDAPVHPACRCAVIPAWPGLVTSIGKKFNPRQVRDEHGRWADMPGSGIVVPGIKSSRRTRASFWEPDQEFWDDEDLLWAPLRPLIRERLQESRPVELGRSLQRYNVSKASEELRDATRPGMYPDQFNAELSDRVTELFDGKDIAVRMSSKTLDSVLRDGRIKSQFEAGTAAGIFDPTIRANLEERWFGIPAQVDPTLRPIYGYVMVDGERAAQRPHLDALSAYGALQVVLNPEVRDRSTGMVGDSVDDIRYGRSSPITDPSWESFTPAAPTAQSKLSNFGLDRDYSSPEFRRTSYVEAQIHGGVAVSDIDHVVAPKVPSDEMRSLLDDAGVPWVVRRPEAS